MRSIDTEFQQYVTGEKLKTSVLALGKVCHYLRTFQNSEIHKIPKLASRFNKNIKFLPILLNHFPP